VKSRHCSEAARKGRARGNGEHSKQQDAGVGKAHRLSGLESLGVTQSPNKQNDWKRPWSSCELQVAKAVANAELSQDSAILCRWCVNAMAAAASTTETVAYQRQSPRYESRCNVFGAGLMLHELGGDAAISPGGLARLENPLLAGGFHC